MKTQTRRLMWRDMLLFLRLVTGLLEERFTKVSPGLSAHLDGVMNGIFLLALGAAWNKVRLPHPVRVTAYCTALFDAYANWLVTSIGAAFGTAANSPITSAGHSGQPRQEAVVAMGFLTLTIAIAATSTSGVEPVRPVGRGLKPYVSASLSRAPDSFEKSRKGVEIHGFGRRLKDRAAGRQ